jgi:MFS transporter, AAHS family, 4-hydroxybenzoate transporter
MMPVLCFVLPESVRFLVTTQAPVAKIRAIVEKMAPGATTAQTTFLVPTRPARRSPIRTVLSDRYRFGSMMLWTAYFAALFASNLLSNWLPTLIRQSGYGLRDAALVTGIYQLGGVFGSLVLGWAMDRYHAHRVPSAAYFVSGTLLCGLALSFNSFALVVVQAFGLGFCLIGAISGVNALSAQFYPTEARATGSCWMHGAGRSGALISIFAGAQMLTMGWNANYVLSALIGPALLAGLCILAKARTPVETDTLPHGLKK